MSETAAPPPSPRTALLRPCPFCGAGATLETDPWLGESVRIRCANEACGVLPHTEYLLVRFADELCAAWNGRPPRSTHVADPVDG
ncbi:MAG TPA: hypothetical protein VF665_18605 [Longimicrobium sp.]|uniref:hypothetical protein n=1 Tax=Longimicrobium sp. TaxID=2029185 RepID=UPI002ED9B50B